MKFFILITLPGLLLGHDLYLRPAKSVTQPNEKIRVEFHNGDAFPKSQVTVKTERLRDAKRISASGEAPFEKIHDEENMTVAEVSAPPKGHFYLLSRTIPNFIQLDTAKFEEYLDHEGLGRISAWRKQNSEGEKPGREMYSKYVKSLLVAGSGDGSYSKPAGFEIEFVPLDDPYQPNKPAAIRVQLLFRGKPAAGHEVELQSTAAGKIDRKILGNTDAQGLISVPIVAGGFHKLHAIIMERRSDRKQADWDSYWATLTFSTR